MVFAVRPNHHCISTLDVGAGTLTLKVKCFLATPTTYTDSLNVAGTVTVTTYNCTPVTPQIRQNFEAAFIDSINAHWHNKIWLELVLPDPTIDPLQCGVEIEFVQQLSQAHLNMKMLCSPNPVAVPGRQPIPFRSFCYRSGRAPIHQEDMVIAYPANGASNASAFSVTRNNVPTTDEGLATITQNTAAHEFGHYLGLRHRCFSPITSNAAADYCTGLTRALQENMMAVGNVLTTAHGDPFVLRLRRHHYHNERAWMGNPQTQRPPAFDPGLIDSLAGGP